MPSTAVSAAALLSPAALLDQQAEDAQRYRALLHELMDVGMELVRAVQEQAAAERSGAEPGAPASLHDAAAAFDLLSRAVRRTVALARRVAEPLPARADPAQARAAARAAARRRIIREVEDAIQRPGEGLDEEAAGALRAELGERLDGAELDEEIGSRPTGDIIADICRDLGFGRFLGNHPWKRRTPPDIAALHARAAQPSPTPGSPAPKPATAYHVVPHPGPRPYTPEGAMALMHELLAVQQE